jgi:hypothetical protein
LDFCADGGHISGMNTQAHIAAAEAYYQAYLDGDLERVASFVHPEIHFKNPSVELRGKEAFLEAARNLVEQIRGIEVRARFGAGEQIMLAYDMRLKGMEEPLSAAVLMGFKDGLIASIELFFDTGAPRKG